MTRGVISMISSVRLVVIACSAKETADDRDIHEIRNADLSLWF